MRRIGILLLAGMLLLSGCAPAAQSGDVPEPAIGYRQIDQETAKQMMAQDDGHLVVDVRRFDEYRSGHIPGAICIPNESIDRERPEELADPEQILLIYCRSGRRSKEASEKLAALGFSNVYEFGGILDWTGETVPGQTLMLTLESNPTTGFSWEAAQEQALFEIQSFYTAEAQSQPLSGAGGWQSFVLAPTQAGEASVRFCYSRPWEPNASDPQFTFGFAIGDDLSITVTEDGSAAAAEQGYAPSVRIYR